MNLYVSTRVRAMNTAKAKKQIAHDYRVSRYIAPHWRDNLNAEGTAWTRDGKEQRIKGGHRDWNENEKTRIRQGLQEYLQKNGDAQKARACSHTKREIKNLYIAGVLTFSADGIKNIPTEQMDGLAKETVVRIGAELGVKPIYYVRHDDETTRHYHYMLEAVNDKGRSSAASLYRDICRKLQDIAGEVWGKVGLRRGEKKEVTNANYQSLTLSHRIAEAKAKKRAEEEEARVDRNATRAANLNAAVNDLTQEKEKISAEIKELRKTRAEYLKLSKTERAAYNAEISAKRAELKELKKAIEDVQKEKREREEIQKKAEEEAERLLREKTEDEILDIAEEIWERREKEQENNGWEER